MSVSVHSDAFAGDFRAVVLAASAGGPHALRAVLGTLPADFSVPVLVVQHRTSTGQDNFDTVLRSSSPLPVRLATDGEPISTPGVAVVPAGYAVTLDEHDTIRLIRCDNASVASTTISTVADRFGSRSIGVVLTGRLDDSRQGVQSIKRSGGRVLVQDPATAEATGMPTAALSTGCVDFVLPLERIGSALISLTMAPGGAQLLTSPTPHWASTSA